MSPNVLALLYKLCLCAFFSPERLCIFLAPLHGLKYFTEVYNKHEFSGVPPTLDLRFRSSLRCFLIHTGYISRKCAEMVKDGYSLAGNELTHHYSSVHRGIRNVQFIDFRRWRNGANVLRIAIARSTV